MRHHIPTIRMKNLKELFINKSLKSGGFYELSIQVCESSNNLPIQLYTDFVWSLENVLGPFNKEFDKIEINLKNIEHNGIVKFNNKYIPFLTFNIREESPVETGYNWFDICFYSSAIESIFGEEYTTWSENPKSPVEIDEFFKFTLKNLYNIFPFKLAIIDFEASGQYYLNDLKDKIELMWNHPKFYIGKENYKLILESNKKFCSIIEEI
ncbi:hypothetical protein IP98_02979 [Flavobacterium cauense R2A-7]|uniref:Uncharacterized protein n=3 Tax=Flavobacterium TaxID=237 RepID=A0A562LI46_9FLAO|nr:hypothetical protein IP98_02979 [Flavobacterium cauense R2A-7]